MKNNKYVVFFFSGEIKKYINKKEEGVMASWHLVHKEYTRHSEATKRIQGEKKKKKKKNQIKSCLNYL